jgi:hypothetical protein
VAAPLGAVFALFFGLCFAGSRTAAMISDSANNALQAHDLLHSPPRRAALLRLIAGIHGLAPDLPVIPLVADRLS